MRELARAHNQNILNACPLSLSLLPAALLRFNHKKKPFVQNAHFFFSFPPLSSFTHARSPDEVNTLKVRIHDWAAAHGCLDKYEAGDYEFLFKVGLCLFVFSSKRTLLHLIRMCSVFCTRAEAPEARRAGSEAPRQREEGFP